MQIQKKVLKDCSLVFHENTSIASEVIESATSCFVCIVINYLLYIKYNSVYFVFWKIFKELKQFIIRVPSCIHNTDFNDFTFKMINHRGFFVITETV